MRTNSRLPQEIKHPDTAKRRSAVLLSGAAGGNTHAPAKKAQKNDGLAAKTPHTPGKSKKTSRKHQGILPQNLPDRERPPQPKHKAAEPNKRSSTILETEPHKKIKPKWLWKVPQWRRLNRASRVPSPRPLKVLPQATKAPVKQQGGLDVGGSTSSLACSIRSLQLCTSSSETSPSPPVTRSRRATHAFRSRRYLKQLEWYQALHNEKKRVQRSDQQASKVTSSADSFVVKSTLDNLGLTYQSKKRKRSLLTSQGLPATKKPLRKTSRRLWRRQLDSSSSDSPTSESSAKTTPLCARCMSSSSPGTLSCPASDTFTSPQAAPSTNIKSAPAKIPALSKQFPNDNSISGLKGRKQSEAVSGSTNSSTFSSSHKTFKSPKTRKTVNFKDSPNPGDSLCASATQISDKASRSRSTVSPPSQSRLPSTPHVKKKLERHPKSSDSTKHKVRVKTSRDYQVNDKCNSDKSNSTPNVPHPPQSAFKAIPSPKLVQRETWRPQDHHQRKKAIKCVCQTTSNNSSQTETRLQACPQAQCNTASPKRSEKPLASKATQSTFKQPASASQENLKTINLTPGDNCARRIQTPFRKPDTPRPKSCPKFLKWKKVLERRTESTRYAAGSVSNCQGQPLQKHADLSPVVFGKLAEHSPQKSSDCSTSISKFTQNHLHTFRPPLGYENSCNMEQSHSGKGEITERHSALAPLTQRSPSLNSVQAAAQKELAELQQFTRPSSTLQIAQEHSTSSSSPELTQAIFDSMRFFWGEEAEHASFNSVCHPIPSHDSSAFGVDARQHSASQRTSLSGCYYYIIKPQEPTQPALSQDVYLHSQSTPCWPAQGGGDHYMHALGQQALKDREDSGCRLAGSDLEEASASDRTWPPKETNTSLEELQS